MGNRAVIAFEDRPNAPALYLHWNGGRASVEGFLQAARELGYRSPAADPAYAFARLVQVVTTFFEDGLSVGVSTLSESDQDNGDNGVYIVGGNWQITKRKFARDEEVNAAKSAEIAAHLVQKLRPAPAREVA